MEIGETWAYREKPGIDEYSAIPAMIMRFGPPKSQRVRVQFLDGEFATLERWVVRRCLVVLWNDRDTWFRDERSLKLAREYLPADENSLEYEAVNLICAAYPRPNGIMLGYQRKHGSTVMIEDYRAVAYDLGLDPTVLLHEPLAYINRDGIFVAPYPTGLLIARRIAEVFPELVLAYAENEERQLHLKSIQLEATGIPWEIEWESAQYADRLRRVRPIHDVVQSWCGAKAVEQFDETEALRAEVLRLRELS